MFVSSVYSVTEKKYSESHLFFFVLSVAVFFNIVKELKTVYRAKMQYNCIKSYTQ